MSFQSLLPVLYVLGLYGAYLAGFLFLRARSAASPASQPTTFRFPWLTLFLLLAVGIPTALQFFFPALLPRFQRDALPILQGEWWRLITALFFQDGGIPGAIFNLVSLLFVGLVAEQTWDRKTMLAVFFLGGIVGNLIGLAWQPMGAGNSVANFSLAAGVAVLCLLRRPPRPVQAAALLALCADLLLILLGDIHGPAALTGALLGWVLGRKSK